MKDIATIANECINELSSIGIKVGTITDFTVDTRSKRRNGCTTRNNRTNTYKISIAKKLLVDEISDFPARNTMIHELLHTLPNCMNHGAIWKRYAKTVNEKLGYNVSRCGNYEEYGVAQYTPPKPKYAFVCNDCGQVIQRTRKSKFTEHYTLYRCGCCGGKFTPVNESCQLRIF